MDTHCTTKTKLPETCSRDWLWRFERPPPFFRSRAQGHSSKSEIEVADFDRLFSRLERVEMAHTAMRELLVAIKES